MGSDIFQFVPGKAEKIWFKDFNFALKIQVNTGIAINSEQG